MRIIGGAFRGRKLASIGKGDEAARLRPTSDRVRESLFNVLMSRFAEHVHGAAILDLYAGTGALGLEALSRGATTATFVENGRVAQRILRQNMALCGVEAQCRLIHRDARKLGQAETAFDVIFLDPPYGKGMGEAALDTALDGGWLTDHALVIWEESRAVTVPAGLIQLDERSYGDTVIRILRRG